MPNCCLYSLWLNAKWHLTSYTSALASTTYIVHYVSNEEEFLKRQVQGKCESCGSLWLNTKWHLTRYGSALPSTPNVVSSEEELKTRKWKGKRSGPDCYLYSLWPNTKWHLTSCNSALSGEEVFKTRQVTGNGKRCGLNSYFKSTLWVNTKWHLTFCRGALASTPYIVHYMSS